MNHSARRRPATSFCARLHSFSFRQALTLSMILSVVLPLVPVTASAQAAMKPSAKTQLLIPGKLVQTVDDDALVATLDGAAFVIHADDAGDTTCRDASAPERRNLSRPNRNTRLRVMPRDEMGEKIAPARDNQMAIKNFATEKSETTASETLAATDGNMRIILRETDQLINSPRRDDVRIAFQRAAATWESLIQMPITIVVDVDYGENWFGTPYPSSGVLGMTSGGPSPVVRYSSFLQRVLDPTRTTDAGELALYNALPKTPTVPTDVGAVEWIFVAAPLARALGISPPTVDPNPAISPLGNHPRVGFNSNYSFDFNPNDGVDSDKTDFDAVAVHELGHALGFTSQVGSPNAQLTLGGVLTDVKLMSVWDLFRMRPGTTMATFASAQRLLNSGTGNNDIHAHFAGGAELELSTGGTDGKSGDGKQASHWRDDSYRGGYATPWIGIMDPNIMRGTRKTLTANDVKAVNIFGYQTSASAPPPPPQTLSLNSGVTQTGVIDAPAASGQGVVSTTQYAIDVPAGATNLTVTLGGNSDVDLFVRHAQMVGVANGLVVSDFSSIGDTGSEIISITAATSPALQAGKYYFAIANYGPGGTNFNLTATVVAPAAYVPSSLAANQVELKTWQANGSTEAHAKMTFPTNGYRLANAGSVARSGSIFTVEAQVERSTGSVLQVPTSTAAVYNLGSLAPGNYTFVFRASGAEVKRLSFAVGVVAVKNAIDDSRDFVRQHYRDFLSREADAPGLNFWAGEVDRCGADIACVDRTRVNVSASFFLSPEFQVTGFYVYRLYKGAYGRRPRYQEFLNGVRAVASGIVVNDRLSADVIERNKRQFAQDFASTNEFRQRFDALTNEQYVSLLFQTTGIKPSDAESATLINNLRNGTDSRAAVLAKIVDGIRTATPPQGVSVDQIFETRYGKLFYEAESNRAFVQMQYFGYLQRDEDDGGYDFWLGKLTRFGNYRDAEMVRSFILAAEYRARFGQP